MLTDDTTPRLYIASLSDYNNGALRGEWFQLDEYDDADELLADIGAMLKRFDAAYGLDYGQEREEWACHDSENLPDSYYSEYMSFGPAIAYAKAVADMDEKRREALDAWLANSSSNTIEEFDQHYLGYYGGDSAYDDDKVAAEYAESITDTSDVPRHLKDYIDWESMGRDWLCSGDIWCKNGHVFNS